MIYYTQFSSPLGPILLTSDGVALTGLYMHEHKHGEPIREDWTLDDGASPFEEARQQLSAYFAGTLTRFDLPLAPRGTAFQRRVWEELKAIPYGATISYGELAQRIGNANASRAVGLANGRNPISIIVPCHRVIGANGKLVGYGGGLSRKAALLAFESTIMASGPQPFTHSFARTGVEQPVQTRLDFQDAPLPQL